MQDEPTHASSWYKIKHQVILINPSHTAMKRPFLLSLLLLLGLYCAACAAPPVSPPPTVTPMNSISLIHSDMTLPHEGQPHGVPETYDWSKGPRLGMGNDPGQFKAITAWGQLYLDAQGSPASNVRVHLRQVETYLLSRQDGQWRLVQSSLDVAGAAYREDFVDDLNVPADVRAEPGGGISVRLQEGYNYHFWPTGGRAAINGDDIAGVFTTVQARLVLDDPAGPGELDQARYLLSMGGDYWLSTTAAWDQWKTNGDIAIGRFRYVTRDWQSFNMTTLSLDALEQQPPPMR